GGAVRFPAVPVAEETEFGGEPAFVEPWVRAADVFALRAGPRNVPQRGRQTRVGDYFDRLLLRGRPAVRRDLPQDFPRQSGSSPTAQSHFLGQNPRMALAALLNGFHQQILGELP